MCIAAGADQLWKRLPEDACDIRGTGAPLLNQKVPEGLIDPVPVPDPLTENVTEYCSTH
jgi:hypothetical protein